MNFERNTIDPPHSKKIVFVVMIKKTSFINKLLVKKTASFIRKLHVNKPIRQLQKQVHKQNLKI